MGKGASAKCSTRRVIDLNSNSRFQIPDFKHLFRLALFFCVFCVLCVNVSLAQNLENLSEQIRFGTTEIKRDTLFQIRNLQSESAARIAVPALKDSSEIVRATAVFSIIYLPKDEAFSLLIPLLQDKSEIVRRETAYALGKVQNPNAVNLLVRLFQKDKIIEVKNAAIVALGEIGDVSAVETLTKILTNKPKEENEFLRRSAARSIGQIAQIIQIKQSYTVTPENFLPEKYKLFTLQKYENLSEEFPQFRNAVPILIKILQNKNESDDTKRESAFALGAIGDVSALPILQQNSNSKDIYLAEICKEAVKKITSGEL
jgi:HEAT repeat protein